MVRNLGWSALSLFRHRAVYSDENSSIEMYLVSQVEQVVRLEGLNLTISLKSGEEIHTENSHKYSVEEIQFLANKAGLELKQ